MCGKENGCEHTEEDEEEAREEEGKEEQASRKGFVPKDDDIWKVFDDEDDNEGTYF